MCKCNENNNPCTDGCNNNCKDFSSSCECPVKDLSTDCSTYKGEDLPCSGITKDTILTKVIQDFDAFICNKFAEAINYLNIENIGTGLDIYKGPNNLGTKEFKRIQQGDYIQITDVNDSIRFDNYKSSETQIGNIEIATQAEANAGTDDERAITPLKMKAGVINILEDNSTNITIDPANLPQATEIAIGAAELATQAEADAGTDDEKIVTPLKMKQGVINILEDNSTVITINPDNLPNATETQRGIAEIATQAEVNAGTDDTRFITPAKLKGGVDTIIENNNTSGGGQTFLPSGIISMWSGDVNALPTDWHLCNGQTVGTFTTPDLRGKFIVGFDPANADYSPVGDTGGSNDSLITLNNLPEHDHPMDFRYSGAEQDNQIAFLQPTTFTDSSPQGESGGDGTGGANGNITIQTNMGGGVSSPTPLDNRPEYFVMAYIIYLPQ